MKIALISLHTPTKENMRGASALPYHLMKYRPLCHDVDIFSYNLNNASNITIKEVEKELRSTVYLLPLPKWYEIINKKIFKIIKVFYTRPILSFLNINNRTTRFIQQNYDAIWIYGEDIESISSKFQQTKPCIITTPDCEALFYNRVISIPSKISTLGSFVKNIINYYKYLQLSKKFKGGSKKIFHLVGQEDEKFLQNINTVIKTVFLPHPHYDGIERNNFKLKSDKIKLLIPGRYDFYAKEAFEIAMNVFIHNADLASNYEITFLGKGFNSWNEQLKAVGYSSKVITFADVYNEELFKHDIQLSPITVGTGTKGKVLDAFINGLLVIGTLRALENIQVDFTKDCVYYETGNELLDHLRKIPQMRSVYEEKRKNGYLKVRKNHSPSRISEQFFQLFFEM